MIKILLILFITNLVSLNAQLLRNDDFQFKSNHWYWRADGNQSIPTVSDGLLHLELVNAVDSFYCNTEIYDNTIPYPYNPGTQVKMRIKASPQHIGSRGWGFWDGIIEPSEIFFDYDVAWIMQQAGEDPGSNYNWFLFGVDGNLLFNRSTIELSSFIDETDWHTYKIIWRSDSTFLYIDNTLIFVDTDNLPNQNMRVDLWIDNRVLNINTPWDLFPPPNFNSAGSEMFVDYIEVSGISGPEIPRNPSGNIIVWDSPNTYASGDDKVLWKNYTFNTHESGEGLVFITGNAESYNSNEDDDDLKLILDSQDYGWNNLNSLDGDDLDGKGRSLAIVKNFSIGQHTLEIHSDVTPFLRDVIVLHSENGAVLLNEVYNQTAESGNGEWKDLPFSLQTESEIVFLISGSGVSGDKIRIEIDGTDYLWTGENAIDGDELEGIPKTIVIKEILSPGNHNLKVYKLGSPTLFNIAAYSSPVSHLNIKVFLEGSFVNIGGMISSVSQSNDFPLNQPFNRLPWNYNGNETISTLPLDIIDWVLIELRDLQNSPTKKYYQAGLLRNDGIIVNTSGEMIKFLGMDPGNYFIAIYHRNHLPVVSSSAITIL